MEKLLIVEDDSGIRDTMATFLEMEGYAVDAVSSTGEALQRIGEELEWPRGCPFFGCQRA